MHPEEKEIREVASVAPLVSFTFVTASGERERIQKI
jgi:hypothetical protein